MNKMGNYYGQPAPSEGDGKAARFICPLIFTALALMGVATGIAIIGICVIKVLA